MLNFAVLISNLLKQRLSLLSHDSKMNQVIAKRGLTSILTKSLTKVSIAMSSALLLTNCATAELISNGQATYVDSAGVTVNTTTGNGQPSQRLHNDSMQTLIERQQQHYANSKLTVEERQRIRTPATDLPRSQGSQNIEHDHKHEFDYEPEKVDIETWLNAVPSRRQNAIAYYNYLASQIGRDNVPPMSQLLVTARDWYKCGFEPYEVPPRHLWDNNINTLKLYAVLKQRGILPPTTEMRSAYRNEALNACAEGAATSRHVVNGAIDIWVPEYENDQWAIHQLQDRLCTFRLYEGPAYNFGLGLYKNNSYHIDTYRSRMWGGQYTQLNSPCRTPIEEFQPH